MISYDFDGVSADRRKKRVSGYVIGNLLGVVHQNLKKIGKFDEKLGKIWEEMNH